MPNRLRECRKAMHLTTVEVGKRVGVTDAAISMYETGKREPPMYMYQQFADLYKVSIDYLTGRSEESEKKELPPVGQQLDNALISLLTSLSPQEVQRVQDFVAGMKANRKG